jgi:serine/threonine protein kinase
LAENIGTFVGGEGEEGMEKFPNWLEAKAKGGDDYPLLWVDGNNPLGTRGIAGTFWYTAPEVFRNERYSFGMDYYSVGVIYYELITGRVRKTSSPESIPCVDLFTSDTLQ